MNKELFEDWTIDYRLKQLRRCKDGWENGGKIDFIDFDSDLGQAIFEKKILLDELLELVDELNKEEITIDEYLAKQSEINEQVKQIENVINLIEKEQTNNVASN
jgi:type I site-specific restriction-modification system R (restriction) subunit